MRTVKTELLEIGFEEGGPEDGSAVHFPHREASVAVADAILHHLQNSMSQQRGLEES